MEGAKAALPKEQAASGYRQKGDAAARSHEEGQLCQALELSLRCQGLLYPELATTLESESEEVEDAPPFCPIEPSLRCPSLSNPDLTATSQSELKSESEGGEAALFEEQAGGGYRQEVDVAARSNEEEVPRQTIERSLRHLGLSDLDLTITTDSGSESEGVGLVAYT